MPKTPIEMMLDGTEWIPIPDSPDIGLTDSDIPVATHSGVLEISDYSLRCFRLSNGEAVFDAEDFESFFESIGERVNQHD